MKPAKQNDLLVWMDLEMTGLDPEKDTILEIATVITDGELRIVAEGPDLVIHQSEHVLKSMSPWCIEHHGASGLTQRVRESQMDLQQAEDLTLNFIRSHVPERGSPLCGNSVHQDRRFLQRYMPRVEQWLHYRNIDVSTIKELAKRWYPDFPLPSKAQAHLAMADIHESIKELHYYRKHLFVQQPEDL